MLKSSELATRPSASLWRYSLLAALALPALAFLLAWVSSGFAGVQGWLSFLGALAAAAALLAAGVWLVQAESPPAWLIGLLALAAVLRLALGPSGSPSCRWPAIIPLPSRVVMSWRTPTSATGQPGS
jgi:hypothetical protein